MKINSDDIRIPAPQRGTPAARPATQLSTRQESEALAGDSARFSPAAQQANRLKAILRQVPEVRMDLVWRIKAQVDAGTYKVDPDDVADKLLKSGVLE